MDNIAHSLVGVALAEVVTRRGATKAERRVAVGAGIVATNLPDIDIAYSVITEAPIGYLLHHRGHTHTVIGLGVLAFALALAYRVAPRTRRPPLSEQFRLWLLIAMALASHLLLDALNNYGVHPFYPFDSTWYFADAVFIFEPSLWLILGIFAACNAGSRMARFAAALPTLVLPVAMVSTALIPIEGAALLVVVGALFAWTVLRMSPRARAAMALATTVVILAGLLGTSHTARTAATTALEPEVHGRLVDVILTPNPASPLCWGVIGVELDEPRGQYVLWRGTLSLAPEWKKPTTCVSHRMAEPTAIRMVGNGGVALRDGIRQPLDQLRDLARRDCWTRAWLQFGRAPLISGGTIVDLRFADRAGHNFTGMAVNQKRPAPCPSNLPNWGMPRADLLK